MGHNSVMPKLSITSLILSTTPFPHPQNFLHSHTLSLDQKSDRLIVMDVQLMMRKSGEAKVDSTDIGASDHFLIWLELGKVTKCCIKLLGNGIWIRFVEDDVRAGFESGG